MRGWSSVMSTVFALGFALGCDEPTEEADAPPAAAVPSSASNEVPAPGHNELGSDAAALERARAAAKELGGTLKRELLSAMERGGPEGAIAMCAEEAQSLTRAVAERTAVDVGRASLRLRNPENAPPPWVHEWLTEQGDRDAKDARGLAEVVSTKEGPRARVLVPIGIEGPCLSCHGDREAIHQAVKLDPLTAAELSMLLTAATSW